MNGFELTTEELGLIVGVVTMLIASFTLLFYIRDRKEICKVFFKIGTGKDVVTDKGGAQSFQNVPGFEVLILNKGVVPLYVSNVYICNKLNEERFRCSFGLVPLSETPNSRIVSFTNRFSFELVRNRMAKSNPPISIVISQLKLSDFEKATLYVLVELESQNTVQSKHLTFRIKDIEPGKTE